MPHHFKVVLVIRLLIVTFVIVPLALYLLGRGPRSRAKRILSGLAFLVLGATASSLGVLLFLELGVLELQWHGGYTPTLAVRKTKASFKPAGPEPRRGGQCFQHAARAIGSGRELARLPRRQPRRRLQ